VNERKERPILFSGPMVRAILEGRKTQTRRVVKPQPPADHPFPQPCVNDGYWWNDSKDDHDDVSFWPTYSTCLPCPYGKPGDQLWARETHCKYGGRFIYRADYGDLTPISDGIGGPWKPSIHMPRIASRITLEITGVRVERLQDISEADVIAEGVSYDMPIVFKSGDDTPRGLFGELWESIHGEGSWDLDPWVWVIEFQKVEVAK